MTVNTSPTNSRVKEPPVNKEVNDLTVLQELRTLKCVKQTLDEARNMLGGRTRFTDLANSINAAILKAQAEVIAADDYITERS